MTPFPIINRHTAKHCIPTDHVRLKFADVVLASAAELTVIMKIAVVGATGLVGRQVVEALRVAGVETVAVSPEAGVDVTTGAGLDEALAGVGRIVDVTNAGTTEEKPATGFFTAVSERLQQAGTRAGVQRVIVLSIVGIDRLQRGYWAAKLQHERVAQSGPVPTSILRSTQFHEFAAQVLAWGRNGDVRYVPEMRVQPIASASVSEVLVDMALANDGLPAMSEIAGPRIEQLLDMAIQVAARHHEPPRVEGRRDTIRAPTAPPFKPVRFSRARRRGSWGRRSKNGSTRANG
jgi:uncharacterized protein YbjT (DUF2867 family)